MDEVNHRKDTIAIGSAAEIDAGGDSATGFDVTESNAAEVDAIGGNTAGVDAIKEDTARGSTYNVRKNVFENNNLERGGLGGYISANVIL